jgi:hypothetical protein
MWLDPVAVAQARAAIEAMEAHLEASGVVMVPKDATEEMSRAWFSGYWRPLALPSGQIEPQDLRERFREAYGAMVSAAPSPFSQANTEGEAG